MITADALDVILRVQNLRVFQRGMAEGAASVRSVGTASKETAAANNAAAASMNRTLGVMALARKATLGLAAAVVGVGFESYKMGVDFDQQMTMIQTQSGGSAAMVAKLRNQILDMHTAFSKVDLATAMREIVGIGFPAARNFEILKAAAAGAAQGNADVTETVKTLAGTMKTNIPGAMGSAKDVMAALNATVGTGVMTLDDLNHALGTGVLPTAKEYGLTLDDITGALAIFTDEHMQGSSSMAQLSTAMHFLTGSTKKGKEALASIGLSGKQMAANLHSPKGLLVALTALHSHLKTAGDRKAWDKLVKNSAGVTLGPKASSEVYQSQILDELLPGGRGRIMKVLMNQLENYSQKIDQNRKIRQHRAENEAKTEETAAIRIRTAWHDLQGQMIRFSDTYKEELTPAVVAIVTALKDFVWVLTQGTKHAKEIGAVVVPLTAAFVAYKLATWGVAIATGAATFATTGWVGAFWALDAAMAANPIGIIVGAIVGVAVAFLYAYHNVKWFHNAVDNVFSFIRDHWPLLGAILLGPFGAAAYFIITRWVKVRNWFRNFFNWVKKKMDDINPLKLPGKILGGAEKLISGIPHPHLAQGTQNWGGGASWVGERGPELLNIPRGASVIPTGQSYFDPRRHVPNPAPAGASGDVFGEIHSHIYIDGRHAAEAVDKFHAKRKARR